MYTDTVKVSPFLQGIYEENNPFIVLRVKPLALCVAIL